VKVTAWKDPSPKCSLRGT